MKLMHHLIATLCTCAVTMALCADASAESQAPPAIAQRTRIKTPLGRLPQEVLGMKVVVTDMPKSLEYYTKVIGLKPAKALGQPGPGPAPTGTDPTKWPSEYGLNYEGEFSEAFFDLLRPTPTEKPTPQSASMTTLMFKVPDAPAVIQRAKDMGYQVIREAPIVKPGEMSIGMLRDPDGYRVEIIQAASYPSNK